jgi:predicted dehydrogenase
MTNNLRLPVRFGLVGTGIGRLHAQAIAGLPGTAELVAVCGLPLASAEALAAEFKVSFATDDYEALLRRPEVEVIDLCVPHNLHLPMAEAAARAGKHVLIEKPLARNLVEADAIIHAARSNGISLMVAHNQRYFGHHAKAKALLEDGAIGTPYLVVAYVHVYGRIQGFRTRLAEAGGGTLIDSGVHRFDLLRWLMGDVASVYTQMGRFLQMQMEGEDCAVVSLRFKSDAIGSFSCSWSAKGRQPREGLEIYGPYGSILTEDHTRSLRLYSERPPAGLEDVSEFIFPVDQVESMRREIAAFAASIRQGTEPPVTGYDGRAALELAVASYESARVGQPVKLPL